MAIKKKKLKDNVQLLIYLVVLVTIIVCFFSKLDFNKTEEIIKKREDLVVADKITTSASLIMMGDALIHNAVYYAAYDYSNGGYNFLPMFERIKPIVEKYDLKYYNQETILGGTSLGLASYPQFNSPQEVGDAYLDMGINLVSLSTNHTMDYGRQAIINSREYWDSKDGVIAAGSYTSFEQRDTPVIKEINGITYTLLSYTTWNNGLRTPYGEEYLNNEYSDELAKNDIERVRDKVDVVLVAMHWGTEYSFGISYQQEQIASYLASLGVDIIIGTHPHVVEPIEFIGKTMVIYSLGNSISAQIGVERLTGLMASVVINKTVDNGITTIELSNPKAELIFTDRNNSYKIYPYKELNNNILYNYDYYYNYFMDIVVPSGSIVERG